MKPEQKFKLIDGVFSSQESKEILTSVFSSKIQFHQRKNFSTEERYGKKDETALKRIPELKKSVEQLLKVLEESEKNGLFLDIQAEIIINYIES
jgi:hypothetical protein